MTPNGVGVAAPTSLIHAPRCRRRLASMGEGDFRLLYNRHYAVGADVKGTLIYESPFPLLSPRDPDGSHQPDRGT